MDGHEKVASFVLDQVEAKGVCQIIYSLGGVGRARVTCTGHVHRQSLHRALGALGQSIIKIINRSTHFINELPYTNFVTATIPTAR
jgi:hypothetical protein